MYLGRYIGMYRRIIEFTALNATMFSFFVQITTMLFVSPLCRYINILHPKMSLNDLMILCKVIHIFIFLAPIIVVVVIIIIIKQKTPYLSLPLPPSLSSLLPLGLRGLVGHLPFSSSYHLQPPLQQPPSLTMFS